MEKKKSKISKLEATSFADIPCEENTKWFWTDTDTNPNRTTSARRGVHLVEKLPTELPPFATHIWGWGSGYFIRLRVDASLQYGFVGVQLLIDKPGEENCVVCTREAGVDELGWGLGHTPINLKKAKIMQVRLLDNPEMSVEFIELELENS